MTQEKVGLKIVNLIHDITQLGYEVKFCQDFKGMLRLEFWSEYDDNFYSHMHLGCPDGDILRLEKQIIEELRKFYEQYREQK